MCPGLSVLTARAKTARNNDPSTQSDEPVKLFRPAIAISFS